MIQHPATGQPAFAEEMLSALPPRHGNNGHTTGDPPHQNRPRRSRYRAATADLLRRLADRLEPRCPGPAPAR